MTDVPTKYAPIPRCRDRRDAPMRQYSADNGSMTDWHLIHLGLPALPGALLTIEFATSGRAPRRKLDENERAMVGSSSGARWPDSADQIFTRTQRKASIDLPGGGNPLLATEAPSVTSMAHLRRRIDRDDLSCARCLLNCCRAVRDRLRRDSAARGGRATKTHQFLSLTFRIVAMMNTAARSRTSSASPASKCFDAVSRAAVPARKAGQHSGLEQTGAGRLGYRTNWPMPAKALEAHGCDGHSRLQRRTSHRRRKDRRRPGYHCVAARQVKAAVGDAGDRLSV